jgi:hypothetical protein
VNVRQARASGELTKALREGVHIERSAEGAREHPAIGASVADPGCEALLCLGASMRAKGIDNEAWHDDRSA